MSYTYSKVDDLKDEPVVGSHQCVALIQLYAGAPVSSAWRQGDAVLGNRTLQKGTAIATFVDGRYPNQAHGNHAAFFVKEFAKGIWIMDQWKSEKKTTISLRFLASLGKNKQGKFIRAIDNAEAYSVIE